ncbi:MAG: hypothetical protein WAW86_01545 [Gammaproteobacteria bacterium]
MECRYYLDTNPTRAFTDAERALIALSQDGIMQGEMIDRNFPGIIIQFNIETGDVKTLPYFQSENSITYLYAEPILEPIVVLFRNGIACVARLFLFDELVRVIANDKIKNIIRESHYDTKGQRINFELDHCRDTQKRIIKEFKPGFSFFNRIPQTNRHQEQLYKIIVSLDLEKIKCTHDVMAKIRFIEMGGSPRPGM